ncbi:MAG: glycosyltransferase family 9 protein [Victivallaceae bacterium]|nr:glycosyltransferase family 9 protein [Victivallaceae bacterium]
MGKLNNFRRRAQRKIAEHLENDPSGKSLLAYSWRYLVSKINRLVVPLPRGLSPKKREEVIVALYCTGGLGDLVIFARYVNKLATLLPNCRFVVFHPNPGSAKWVFGLIPAVEAFFPLEVFDLFGKGVCDCAIICNSCVFFKREIFNTRKIRKVEPDLIRFFAASQKQYRIWEVFIDNHPVLDGAFARQALAIGRNRQTFFGHMLGIDVPPLALDFPSDDSPANELTSKFGTFVTFNTGFDTDFIISSQTATKCYPEEHWSELIALIKKTHPDVGVVQIGGPNSVHIEGVDIDLAGKTTLPQCCGILSKSRLHIDIEGGLVHVAASLGTKCVVLFGPTNMDYFAYPGNINLRDGNCSECWWATERWMELCPKKMSRNECMYRLTPEKVCAAVTQELSR